MYRPPFQLLLLLLALLPSTLAQWIRQTQVDEDSGFTVVDSVSYGRQGTPVATRVVSTILDAADDPDAATDIAALPTTAPPRIVGQPDSVTGVATIVFEFTSSDGNVYTATFTPSYQSPSPTIPPSSGTIISAADWTFTQAAAVASGAREMWPWAHWARLMAVAGVGVVVGGWWVL